MQSQHYDDTMRQICNYTSIVFIANFEIKIKKADTR